MWPNPQLPTDLVIFTEKILNGKLHLLRSIAHNFVTPLLTWRRHKWATPTLRLNFHKFQIYFTLRGI